MWTLVSALRAGALGQPYAVTTSLVGSDLGRDLAAAGRLHETDDPRRAGRRLGLVAALRPDVTFVHVPLADAAGRTVSLPPFGEGWWGALAARRGVIVTAERIGTPEEVMAHRNSLALPPHRMLAVCRVPSGASPQPLIGGGGLVGYPDDFEQYAAWRELAEDPIAGKRFVQDVLQRPPIPRSLSRFMARRPRRLARSSRRGPATPAELAIVHGARVIAERVRAGRYQVVLAGLGQSYFAARLARQRLGTQGIDVAVMVETGLYDLACGPDGGPFLLGHDTIAGATRLTAVEDVLGALTCGAGNRCLGVLGAAQIDPTGAINSTRLGDGRVLVGSGGANDIASSAAEVVVITAHGPRRLVPKVDHVTSPGTGVSTVVTDRLTLRRLPRSNRWRITALHRAGVAEALDCGWQLEPPTEEPVPVTAAELSRLRRLDPAGIHW